MNNQPTNIPKWYWGLAIFFLLWNFMGVASFCFHIFISEESLQALPAAERELYASYPFWTKILFAIAVIGGTIGSIGLILRKKWAFMAFLASLLAVVPQMTHSLFFTKAKEVYGPGTETMPIMIVLAAVFLAWFSSFAIKKDWLK